MSSDQFTLVVCCIGDCTTELNGDVNNIRYKDPYKPGFERSHVYEKELRVKNP